MRSSIDKLRQLHPWPNQSPDGTRILGSDQNQLLEGSERTQVLSMLLPRDPQVIVVVGNTDVRGMAEWLRLVPRCLVIAIRPDPPGHSQVEALWAERDRLTFVSTNAVEGLQQLYQLGIIPDLIYFDARTQSSVNSEVLACCLDRFSSSLILGDGWQDPVLSSEVTIAADQRQLPIAACQDLWWLSPVSQTAGVPRVMNGIPPENEKVVALTLFRRAGYSRQTLEALSRCHGIDDYLVLIHVEPGYPEVLQVARDVKFSRVVIVENADLLGCTQNTLSAVLHGFQHADFVVCLDDDTVPAPDCLRYFEWARHAFRDDKSVFTVTGFARYTPDPSGYYAAERIRWFTPWSWATWRDRLPEIINRWDYLPNASWDISVNQIRGNRFEVHPLLARTQNIGAEQGTYCPSPEFHREHQYYEFGAWSVPLDCDAAFHEVATCPP